MKRNFAKSFAVAALCALPFSLAAEAKEKKIDRGEAELAEILEGYQAGEPVNCLNRAQRDRLRIVDGTALVFRDRQTIYVNRTNAPRYIDDFNIPVFKQLGSRICRSDQVEFVSRLGGTGGQVIALKQFIPYTKIQKEN